MSIELLADAPKRNEAKDDIATTVTLQLLPLQDKQKRNKLKLNRKRTHPAVSGQTRPFRRQRKEEADANEFMLWDGIDSRLNIPPAPAIATVRAPPPVETESDDQNANTTVVETQHLDEQSNSGGTIVVETQHLDEQSNSG
eukprot:scaffold250663_cov47-Attheya_sp.AAC.1